MKNWFIFIAIGLLFISCDDELKSTEEDAIFDRISLLTSVADNHAIPEYKNFVADVSIMVTTKNTFIADKTEANLVAFRNAYLKAYTSFQPVAKYDFSLAQDVNFYQNLNAHPLRLANFESFILNQNNENLESVLNQDRQGFPAIDYLINGLSTTDTEILEFYTGENATDYTTFLSKIVDRINTLSTNVATDWENNLRASFISDGAFLNIFVNSYIQYFEKRLRASKIDFPAGKFDGSPSPEQIESVFKPEESKALLIEALESSRTFYTGVNAEADSLSKVLITLGEEGLDAQIKLKFLEALNVVNGLNDNLKLQVETDNTKMLEARDALQEIVRLLKIDLTSKLNIAITFQDNDGD